MAYVEQFFDTMYDTRNALQNTVKPYPRGKRFFLALKLLFLKLQYHFKDIAKKLIKQKPITLPKDEIEREVTRALLASTLAASAQGVTAKLRQPNVLIPEVYSSVLSDSVAESNGSIGYLSFYGQRVMNHLIVVSFKDDIRHLNDVNDVMMRNIFNKVLELDRRYKNDKTETVTLWRQNNERLSVEYLVVQA
jgi:hypothetical protein